ncbi:MAG: Major facilitator superfamily 1 [Hyphomicrobiales bacterium]|nr:Major facilitator superfamily 1 [Hyphomicrobiales bacterium]
MFRRLITSRRFAPLFVSQFFSAFNDNYVRNMLVLLILFRLGDEHAGPLVTLAIALFMLPSIFLSALGGEWADAHDKAMIARRLKFAEIFVQMVAAAGFALASLPMLYGALVGLGIIAALFTPVKYGILPDHLAREELPAGNALIEGATFVAILGGIIFGGLAAGHDRSALGVTTQLMVIAALCYGASLFIPATSAGAPGLRPDRNIFRSTWRCVAELKLDPRIWTGAQAVSWFWLVGAVSLSLVPVLIKQRIGGGIAVETAVNAMFAIGIAVGSLLAAIIAHGRIWLTPTPIAALAMAGFLIDLGLATSGLTRTTASVSLFEFFESGAGLRIAIDVTGLAAAAGLFVVPAFAAVQAWAKEARRARVIAGVNIVSSLYMVGATLVTALLQSAFVGLSEPQLLILLGLLNLGASLYFWTKFTAKD